MEPDNKTAALALEIIRYLDVHPDAADTVVGITHWWLKRQRYEDLLEDVQEALDYLVERKSIKKVKLNGNGVIYVRCSDQLGENDTVTIG